MKRNIVFTLIMLLFCSAHKAFAADPIITFFIKSMPATNKNNSKAIVQHLSHPGILNAHIMKKKMGFNQGIFATYAGFSTVSNKLGQIILPRKQEKPTFNMIISDKIKPIMKVKGIVDHWKIGPGAQSAAYMIEKKKSEDTGLYYWNVKRTKLDEKKDIPLHSIVLLAKSSSIIVPQGITLAHKSPNLLLPPIYAKSSLNEAANALAMLSLNQFFEPIRMIHKSQPAGFMQMIYNK